jgi:hypothetical protein
MAIGAVLASFLLKRGYDVVGLDMGFYRDAWLYNNGGSTLPSVKNKDLWCTTADDIVGMDAVVHLAELSNDPLGSVRVSCTPSLNVPRCRAISSSSVRIPTSNKSSICVLPVSLMSTFSGNDA